ncbi:hypothetical protein LY90DRAFT_511373 [Neocallimastix californiae]|uniref:Uncharacterized protein n=1 Tax=Neocallimastix californiae TaxID=1754190 RepID=A0A1Y2BQE5_9FUNG|nr:hypothetical protein LY90DRAFT_511373 [Neocallimastix californiae]|eukprot:ORY36950.1 hypothetical protein LY90DRAFT_511373 [Neocallimastix californiae]
MSTTNENYALPYSSYANSHSSTSYRSIETIMSNLPSIIESHFDLRKIYDANGNKIENLTNDYFNEDVYKNMDNNGNEIETEVLESPNFRLRHYRTRLNPLNNSFLNYNDEGKIIDKSQSYINYNSEFNSNNDNIIHSVIEELHAKFLKTKPQNSSKSNIQKKESIPQEIENNDKLKDKENENTSLNDSTVSPSQSSSLPNSNINTVSNNESLISQRHNRSTETSRLSTTLNQMISDLRQLPYQSTVSNSESLNSRIDRVGNLMNHIYSTNHERRHLDNDERYYHLLQNNITEDIEFLNQSNSVHDNYYTNLNRESDNIRSRLQRLISSIRRYHANARITSSTRFSRNLNYRSNRDGDFNNESDLDLNTDISLSLTSPSSSAPNRLSRIIHSIQTNSQYQAQYQSLNSDGTIRNRLSDLLRRLRNQRDRND